MVLDFELVTIFFVTTQWIYCYCIGCWIIHQKLMAEELMAELFTHLIFSLLNTIDVCVNSAHAVSYRLVLSWGGLRGILTAALGLVWCSGGPVDVLLCMRERPRGTALKAGLLWLRMWDMFGHTEELAMGQDGQHWEKQALQRNHGHTINKTGSILFSSKLTFDAKYSVFFLQSKSLNVLRLKANNFMKYCLECFILCAHIWEGQTGN